MPKIYLIFFLLSCTSQSTSSLPLSRSPIYVSSNAGLSWTPLDLGLPDNTEMSFMKTYGEEILFASDNQGLFISQDNVKSVRDITNGLPNKKIDAIEIYKNTIYASAYRVGIFKSIDQGKSWESLNFDLPNLKVNCILQTEEQLIVGTDIGIYKLDAAKKSWVLTSPSAQFVSINQYKGKLISGSTLGVFISTDGGNSWKNIHNDGALHNTEILNGKIVAMYIHGGLFTSDDWGGNWQEMNYIPRRESYVYDATVWNNYFIISNNYGIHRSADQGQSWQLVYPQETAAFLGFLLKDGVIYGGTRNWDEFRRK